jgi:MFS family permease
MQQSADVRHPEFAETPTRQRVVLVIILLVTLLVAYLDRVNVSVLLADTKFLTDMGIKGQPVQMGLLMTLFLIAYGLSNVVLSPLGDKIGPRKAMLISIFLWTISVMIGGLAPTFAIMLIARLILGVGEGMHWPMQSSLAGRTYGWSCNSDAFFHVDYFQLGLASEFLCAGGVRFYPFVLTVVLC